MGCRILPENPIWRILYKANTFFAPTVSVFPLYMEGFGNILQFKILSKFTSQKQALKPQKDLVTINKDWDRPWRISFGVNFVYLSRRRVFWWCFRSHFSPDMAHMKTLSFMIFKMYFLREHFPMLTDCNDTTTPTEYFMDLAFRALKPTING